MNWISSLVALPTPGIMVIAIIKVEDDTEIKYLCRNRKGNWIDMDTEGDSPVDVLYWLLLPKFPDDAIGKVCGRHKPGCCD